MTEAFTERQVVGSVKIMFLIVAGLLISHSAVFLIGFWLGVQLSP